MRRYLWIPATILIAVVLLRWLNFACLETHEASLWGCAVAVVRYVMPWLVTVVLAFAAFSLGQRMILCLFGRRSLFYRRGWRMVFNGVEGIIVAAMVGAGVLALILWVLGWAGWLQPWVVWLIVLLILLKARDGIHYFQHQLPEFCFSLGYPYHWFEQLLPVLMGIWVTLTALIACNPVMGNDACSTRLAAPQLWLDTGRIVPHEAFRFPQLQEMLSAVYLSFLADPGTALQYLCYVGCAAMLYSIGRRYFTRDVALLVAAMWLTIPAAYFCAQQHLGDLILVLYALVAVYAVLRYWDETNWQWLVIAGLTGALAASTKLFGLGVLVIVVILSGRDWWRTSLAGLVVLVPWYLPNVLVYGHPLWPWFGATGHTQAGLHPGFGFGWTTPWVATFAHNVPWALGHHVGRAGPFVLGLTLFIPFADWRDKYVRAIGLMVGLSWASWVAVGIWHDRYLLWTFALHLLLGVTGFARVLDSSKLTLKRTVIAVIIGALVVVALTGALPRVPSRFVVMPDDRARYLNAQMGGMDCVRWLNEQPGDAVVYLVHTHMHRFRLSRPWAGIQWGREGAGRFLSFETSEQWARLRAAGCDWLFWRARWASFDQWSEEEDWEDWFRLVHEQGDWEVYELRTLVRERSHPITEGG